MVVVPNWSSCPFTPKYLIKQVRNGLLHTAADMQAASILRSWIFGYAFLGGDPRTFLFPISFQKSVVNNNLSSEMEDFISLEKKKLSEDNE